MTVKEIYLKPTFFLKRVRVFAASLPIVVIGVVVTLYNLTGLDFMGISMLLDRGPVAAGYIGLIGLPIYFYLAIRSIVKYRSKEYKYISWDERCVTIYDPSEKVVSWREIEQILFTDEYGEETLQFVGNGKRFMSMNLKYLDIPRDELCALLEAAAIGKGVEIKENIVQ